MHKLHGLYAITDAKFMPPEIFTEKARKTLQGGASIIQYRDKSNDKIKRLQQASALKNLCEEYNAIFIVNDDYQLAIDTNADGIHIGMNDISLNDARNKVGKNKIIGVSCYNQFELAQQAEKDGADYIAFGSFFSSPTKPDAKPAHIDLLIQAKKQLHLPVCAIGGIDIHNAPSLISTGTDMLAVISHIFNTDDIVSASTQFTNLFK